MAKPDAERRSGNRRRALLGAIVTYDDGKFSFPCTVRDLSETGARIAIPNGAQIPSQFYLIIVRDCVAYDARRTWQNGAEAGADFDRTIHLADISDPALGYLNRLWLERAAR